MKRLPKQWLIVILIGGILIFVGLVALIAQYKTNPTSNTVPVDTSGWLIYVNSTYHFSMKYPPSWRVIEDGTGDNPVITFYKIGEEKIAGSSSYGPSVNATNISIYPKGLATENILGTRTRSHILLREKTREANDLTLQDGSVFASEYVFYNAPQPWALWGFVWARVAVSNLQTECVVGTIVTSENACMPTGKGNFVYKGSRSDIDRTLEEVMLKTFIFSR